MSVTGALVAVTRAIGHPLAIVALPIGALAWQRCTGSTADWGTLIGLTFSQLIIAGQRPHERARDKVLAGMARGMPGTPDALAEQLERQA